jgi:5-methylcytosine-specific restriction endonuclease McrA
MPCADVIARLLLKEGKAKVKRRCPFTIKLLYKSTEYVDSLTLGVDTGSGTAGFAVSDDAGNIYYASEVELRNDVTKNMTQRRTYRRNRRNRKTRYRKARFLNRRNSKKKGRYCPTIRSKTEAHEREMEFIKSILPIKSEVYECGQFDPAAMKDPSIRSEKKIHWAYQKGAQYGFANVKAAVRARDGYVCQACKGKRKDSHLHVHHIVFRSLGGSDSPDNLITLCETCHQMVHDGKIKNNFKPKSMASLASATQMNVIRSLLLKSHPDAIETFGCVTSENRMLLCLQKAHHVDAAVIASGGNMPAWKTDVVLQKKCVAKGDYQLHKGIRSELAVAQKKIGGFRKFDKVLYRGGEYFIKGRMVKGYVVLMNIAGKTQTFENPKSVKTAACKRITARSGILLMPIHLTDYAVA